VNVQIDHLLLQAGLAPDGAVGDGACRISNFRSRTPPLG
jgi:hypothetical protein